MKTSLSILSIGLGLLACGDGHAEEQASLELQTEHTICQLAWEQNEEQLDPEDRLGNPFPMLAHPHQNWEFKIAANGHTLHLMPAEKLQFQVELDPDQTISGQAKIVDCEVPTAWKVLDSRLRVTFDPKLGNSRQITMINGKPFGSETKGGLYLRHNLIPSDPNDINLAWFLNAADIDEPITLDAIRKKLGVPPEQAITIIRATDILQNRGAMKFEAVAMTVDQEPIRHWAVMPAQASVLWPKLRFLPLGAATSAATLEEAWNKASILDLAVLKLWDVQQNKPADCIAVGTGPKPSCRQIVDDTFTQVFLQAQQKNLETCVHLAWKGNEFAPFFISTFCVSPTGAVRDQNSAATDHLDFLLPTAVGRGQ